MGSGRPMDCGSATSCGKRGDPSGTSAMGRPHQFRCHGLRRAHRQRPRDDPMCCGDPHWLRRHHRFRRPHGLRRHPKLRQPLGRCSREAGAPLERRCGATREYGRPIAARAPTRRRSRTKPYTARAQRESWETLERHSGGAAGARPNAACVPFGLGSGVRRAPTRTLMVQPDLLARC